MEPTFGVGAKTMKGADKKHGRFFIYQMRSGMGDDPNEILTRLTHQVWRTFDQRHGQNTLDPHLWPEIFHTLRHAFQNRLSFHPLCGHRSSCLSTTCVLCGLEPHTHPALTNVYLLETRRPLSQFLKAVSCAVARRLRLKGIRSAPGGRTLSQLLQESMVDALKQHFFMSEVCPLCPARESLGDRRIWARDVLESLWGGMRAIRPEDVPVLEEVEEA
jgi:hypothetical protein